MIKKLLLTILFTMVLSGCSGPQDGVLSSFLYLIGIIFFTLILGPSIWLMNKAHESKNKYISIILWLVSIVSIIIILFNFGSIFAFFGRLLGFGVN